MLKNTRNYCIFFRCVKSYFSILYALLIYLFFKVVRDKPPRDQNKLKSWKYKNPATQAPKNTTRQTQSVFGSVPGVNHSLVISGNPYKKSEI